MKYQCTVYKGTCAGYIHIHVSFLVNSVKSKDRYFLYQIIIVIMILEKKKKIQYRFVMIGTPGTWYGSNNSV